MKLIKGFVMEKKKWNKVLSVLLAMVTALSLLSGCGMKSAEKEDAETITVYLWTTSLYEKSAGKCRLFGFLFSVS